MQTMRPGDYLVLAVGAGVSSLVVALLGSFADLAWLRVLGLSGLVPSAALLVTACVGYGVAAGLLVRDDRRAASSAADVDVA